jgi:hypothetical protein
MPFQIRTGPAARDDARHLRKDVTETLGNRSQSKIPILLICAVVFAFLQPAAAHADVVWPAIILEDRLVSVPPIAAGLMVEIAVLRFGFDLSWKRATLAGIVVNAISTVLGIPLIPLAGVAWEIFPGLVLYYGLGIGTFNPFTWVATFALAVAVTTAIETICLRKLFKVPWSKARWRLWAAANGVSVAVAFATFWIHPMRFD